MEKYLDASVKVINEGKDRILAGDVTVAEYTNDPQDDTLEVNAVKVYVVAVANKV
jgi:hypothetical protein